MNNQTKQFDTITRAHHPFSASGTQYTEACPHFVSRGGSSVAADEGVLCHKAIETRDLSILDTPEQIALVQRCISLEDAELAALKVLGDPDEEILVIGEKYLPVIGSHVE